MKVAFCSGCRRYVPLDQNGACPEKHPRSCLRDVRQPTPEETNRLFAVGAAARSDASSTSASARPSYPQASAQAPVIPPFAPVQTGPASSAQGGAGSPVDAVLGDLSRARASAQSRYVRQAIAVVWVMLLLVVGLGTLSGDDVIRSVPIAVLIAGQLVVAISYTAIALSFGSDEGGPNSTRGVWAMVAVMASGVALICAIPQEAYIPTMPWLLGLVWALYAAVTAFGRPWRDGDPFGREARTADTMRRRTAVLAALLACSAILAGVLVVPDVVARRMPQWWEIALLAFVVPMGACLIGLQLTWARPTPNLVEFRTRLGRSRVLMAALAAIVSPVLVVMVAAVPAQPFLRSSVRSHTSPLEIANGPGLIFLIPLLLVCVGIAIWATIQLTPVGLRRKMRGSRSEAELVAPLGGRLVDAQGDSAPSKALAAARVLLGPGAPRLYTTSRPGFGGYALAGSGPTPVVLVTETVCTQGTPEQLLAVVVWLAMRHQLGFADWWSERAVDLSVDQATLHALYSPMAIVSALERARVGPAEAVGLEYFAFTSDPGRIDSRIAALRSVLYSGELPVDPIDIESAIPKPIIDALEAAEVDRGW